MQKRYIPPAIHMHAFEALYTYKALEEPPAVWCKTDRFCHR